MSIANFLFTPSQQRMLGPLILNPHRKFKLTELLGYAGTGRGGSQNYIKKLVEEGVLKDDHLGNQRQLSINEAFPLYAELRSICLKTFGLTDKLREVLQPVSSQIQEAFVFGSIARGEDQAHSDIDLMVIGRVGLLELMECIAPVEAELGRPIHVNLHDNEEWIFLQQSDSVIVSIINGPTLRILPDATANRVRCFD